MLLENGADATAQKCVCTPPLLLAVQLERNECIRLLLQYGARPDERRECEVTPLCVSIELGNIIAVQYLLLNGANPKLADGRGRTPMRVAVDFGNAAAIKLLSRYGVSCTKELFERAVEKGAYESVCVLLSRGTDPPREIKQAWIESAERLEDPAMEMVFLVNGKVGTTDDVAFVDLADKAITELVSNVVGSKDSGIGQILQVYRKLRRFRRFLDLKHFTSLQRQMESQTGDDDVLTDNAEINRILDQMSGSWQKQFDQSRKVQTAWKGRLFTKAGMEALEQWKVASAERMEYICGMIGKKRRPAPDDKASAEYFDVSAFRGHAESMAIELASYARRIIKLLKEPLSPDDESVVEELLIHRNRKSSPSTPKSPERKSPKNLVRH